MTGLHELAEQGRKIRKEEEEIIRVKKQKAAEKKLKYSFFGFFRRSPRHASFLAGGILGIIFAAMIPLVDDHHFIPRIFCVIFSAAGVIMILLTIVAGWRALSQSETWEKSLPFKLPAFYQRFLNKEFSFFSKGSGTFYYNIGIVVVFEEPFEADVVSDAVIGLHFAGIKVETEIKAMETTLEELENPEMEVNLPEDDEAYFSTPEEPEAESRNNVNADPLILKIIGNHFANGSDFQRFFMRLCDEILIPLHKEYKIVSVHLTNSGDMEFYE